MIRVPLRFPLKSYQVLLRTFEPLDPFAFEQTMEVPAMDCVSHPEVMMNHNLLLPYFLDLTRMATC